MRFLVRLSNELKASPANQRNLSKSAYEVVRLLGADVGNLRVSSSAVELDLLLESETKLDESLRALEAKFGPMLTLRKLDVQTPALEKSDAISEGIELFNEERYWESHEALESAWRRSEGDEKEILQALILVAAALVHLQKNEKEVTVSILDRAYEKFVNYHRDYFGIDIAHLTARVKGMLRTGQPGFFKIETAQRNS